MPENETIALRNKIAELKERINQIYSQSAIDASKSKAFESELSLYLKACEHARAERTEGIRLQHEVTRFGLPILAVGLGFTVYASALHVLFGMLALLGFGVVSCGFMYLLVAAEIRIVRAGEYCMDVEAYFKQYRWSAERNAALDSPGIPLWEEHRHKWDKDLFAEGSYGKTAVYAPFRIAMTLADLLALVCLIHSFIARGSETSWPALIIGSVVWVMAVTLQMLLVNAIINKIGRRLVTKKERPSAHQRHRNTWGNIIRLFLSLDIIFPEETKKTTN